MAKTGTLNVRINTQVKESADRILKQLGIPMSTAIDTHLNSKIAIFTKNIHCSNLSLCE